MFSQTFLFPWLTINVQGCYDTNNYILYQDKNINREFKYVFKVCVQLFFSFPFSLGWVLKSCFIMNSKAAYKNSTLLWNLIFTYTIRLKTMLNDLYCQKLSLINEICIKYHVSQSKKHSLPWSIRRWLIHCLGVTKGVWKCIHAM